MSCAGATQRIQVSMEVDGNRVEHQTMCVRRHATEASTSLGYVYVCANVLVCCHCVSSTRLLVPLTLMNDRFSLGSTNRDQDVSSGHFGVHEPCKETLMVHTTASEDENASRSIARLLVKNTAC
jgi:hypothetical protein